MNGAIIEFWSLEDKDVARGRHYAGVVCNEVVFAKNFEEAWTGSIRITLADLEGWALIPSTPRGKDFFWKLWRRGQEGDDAQLPGWWSCRLPTWSNPYIKAAEIEVMRAELPAAKFRQEVEAEFLDQAGRFFDEFEPTHHYTDWDEEKGQFVQRSQPWHVVDAPPIVQKHWRLWAAEDFGTSASSPTWWWGLFGIDANGDLWVLDEIYESGKTDTEQAQLILERLERWNLASPLDAEDRAGVWEMANWYDADGRLGGLEVQLLPADAFNRPARAGDLQGQSPAETFEARGLPVAAADNDREKGWSSVKRWLHATRVVEIDGEEWSIPRLRIVGPNCPNLVRVMPEIIEAPGRPEDVSRVPKQEDHPCDGVRYGIHTLIPTPGRTEAERQALRDARAVAHKTAGQWTRQKAGGSERV